MKFSPLRHVAPTKAGVTPLGMWGPRPNKVTLANFHLDCFISFREAGYPPKRDSHRHAGSALQYCQSTDRQYDCRSYTQIEVSL